MHSLPLFVRLAGRPVIVLGEGEAAAAKKRLLERAGAQIVGEGATAALAIVAIDEEADAFAAIDRLRARGILINAVDRPVQCDFTFPAIVDRSPILIAVGTGGASAGLAKALRIRLEALLPASLGALAEALFAARSKMRALWPNGSDRRLALDDALSEGGLLDPLRGPGPGDVNAWLAAPQKARAGVLLTLALHSDDPDDLTLGQARLLGRADIIVYHPGISPAILTRARADAVRIESENTPEIPSSGLALFLSR